MKTAIINYNAGNVQSVLYALERLGVEGNLTNNHEEILAADKVIFPGVGEASSTMRYLKNLGLDTLIPTLKQPVLGICLGMQLMCKHSEEGDTECLGIFPQNVVKFQNIKKVPHIGWNVIKDLKTPLFEGLKESEYMYFVHSFYAELGEHTIATTDYIVNYSSALHKDNFYAAQFHPEKSSDAGQKIIENFLNI